MSTVFYGYKIEKQDLWDVVKRLRKLVFLRNIDGFKGAIRSGKLSYQQVKDEIEIEIQVFPFDSENYVFRILESGYELFNKMPADIELFAYDNRSDMLEDPCPLEDIDVIDELIRDKIYFIIPIREVA